MGIPVLVMGQSGSGKSASLRNFDANKIGVFNVAGKPLPFKSKIKMAKGDYATILKGLKKNNLKAYAVDDSQFLMSFEQLDRAREAGYQKYTEIGLHFMELIKFIINETSDDTVVYLLHHTDRNEDGMVKAKTVGKLIDNWITLEGMFSIVLLADVENKEHIFITQSDGQTTAKSPMGMLPEKMPNDLNEVDKAIREYYEFK